jgi:uncharacterized membrane protein (UPF0127 family)
MFRHLLPAAIAAMMLLPPGAMAQGSQDKAAAQSAAETQELVIATKGGERRLSVEIADNDPERSKGLMFRRSMPDDSGMLFDFVTDRPVSMWMKNTYIPLDMLFIGSDGVIGSIAQRTTPLSERTISSNGPVRYVLEINGGLSDKLGIRPGDRVAAPAIGR